MSLEEVGEDRDEADTSPLTCAALCKVCKMHQESRGTKTHTQTTKQSKKQYKTILVENMYGRMLRIESVRIIEL